MNNSKVAIAVNKTVSFLQMLAGIAIVFLFGLCTIMYFVDKDTEVSFLIFCLVLDALGIWLIRSSRKKTRLTNEFKKYVTAISHVPNGYIPDVAASLGTSEDVVRNNLDLMIKKKFFSNAFINLSTNCIIIANKQTPSAVGAGHVTVENASQAAGNNAASAPEMVTVKCKGCGGINTIARGRIGECDYCGSAIKGE